MAATMGAAIYTSFNIKVQVTDEHGFRRADTDSQSTPPRIQKQILHGTARHVGGAIVILHACFEMWHQISQTLIAATSNRGSWQSSTLRRATKCLGWR